MANEKTTAVTDLPISNSDRARDLILPIKQGQILVIGVAPYEKEGKVSYTLHGVQCFADYQLEAGAYGYEIVRDWTNRVDLGYLNAGDIVEPVYGKGFQDKAVLLNCRVVGHLANEAVSKADAK